MAKLLNMHVNSFVVRQTTDSPFSHSEKKWETIIDEACANFDNANPGYRDGVILIPLPIDQMFSGVCLLEEGAELSGTFESRGNDETPRRNVRAVLGQKLPAKKAFAVCYSSIVLAEDGSNELVPEEGNWEIISLNASPTESEEPIHPETLMHNHFRSIGGTATELSDSEFVSLLREGFAFWKDKAMCGG